MPEELSILFDFPDEQPAAHDAAQPARDLPVVPLINTVLFPHMLAPLFVSDARAVAAVEIATAQDRLVVAVAQRDPEVSEPSFADLYSVGVEATVQRALKMPDGTTSIVVQGRRRVRLLNTAQEAPCLRVSAEPIYVEEERTLAVEAMMRAVLSLFEKVVRLSRTMPDDSYIMAMNIDDPGWLADMIASTLPLDVVHRQEILETLDPEERLRRLSILLSKELDVLELESRIHTQVQKEVDRSQREFFLREQMKVIQRELGQLDPAQRELFELRERVAASNMADVARARANDELERLEVIPAAAPEYSVVRTYLDWLLTLPWTEQTEDNHNLRLAATALDDNHYGLPKVKERILEFMAVRQLAGPKQKAPILCFVGPPGVGKTSLGRSIAEALGRKFARLSLGGVHDEAEIRGHRRTYVGALPGRILQTMKDVKSINPVFMLDEVDKLGHDFRGDPAAALLEVLDPEQNNTFSDHYLDVPYDLSKVLFITTANILDTIPDALLDRMEVIELPGYTEEEKLRIAQRFLIPRQLDSHGLSVDTLHFSESALRQMIRIYTYEAGVRNLERELGTICRKTARRIAEARQHIRMIRPAQLQRFLGVPRYDYGRVEEADEIGLAVGMVWTSNGGDVMSIEVTLMEGKGTLTLTGQLGEIMQESAQAALSYARSNASIYEIDVKTFDKFDIHIHVPEGAVPKDGPSAGITLAIALISALTRRPVRRDVAMSGEITLRGRVLPVGGIKEKILGAHRAGIYTIILPQRNERDMEEVPAQIKRQMNFVYVQRMEQVLEMALLAPQPKKTNRTTKKQASKSPKNPPALPNNTPPDEAAAA
ncbi:MAG: endopeptidase La [Chloroflexaceae bacterium]|nr:endopeptidase La [Chloroflexaceae bacterium]